MKFCESELNIPAEQASTLYTYMRIAFFFSNHLLCKLSQLKYLDIFGLYQFTTTCLGICLLLLPLAKSYQAVVAFSVLYGLMDGARYGLMPLIVLGCVGQRRTDQAWGYVSFCVGLAAAIGPIIIGKGCLLEAYETRLFSVCGFRDSRHARSATRAERTRH